MNVAYNLSPDHIPDITGISPAHGYAMTVARYVTGAIMTTSSRSHTLTGYAITLWDSGDKECRRYYVAARNHLAAIDSVLDHTLAPRSAVLSWETMTARQAKQFNREIEGS